MIAAKTMGNQFLRAAILNKDIGAFRNAADRSLFLTEEHPVFDAVAHHVAAFGKLPSPQALALEGVTFETGAWSEESPKYYASQLRRRAAFNAVNSRNPQLMASLKAKDMDGAVSVLRDMLSAAASNMAANDYSSLVLEASRVYDDFRFAKQHPGLRGTTLRWGSLNSATNGAMGGDLVVVAGRPSVGKSWIMLELALAANRSARTLGFASMEMSLMQIARRFLGGMTGINPNSIRAGELAHWAEADLISRIAQLSDDAPIHLFRGDMKKNVSGIAAMMDEFNPDIMYVDAAYLLSPAGRKSGYVSRWESISEVIRELKQLALEKDRPIVVSVQFNRNQKNRAAKDGQPPDLSDIAGSDSIPQDASIVLGATPWKAPFAETRRIIHMMKNREGETLDVGINFRFNPVNFDEIPIDLDTGEAGPIADMSWMV